MSAPQQQEYFIESAVLTADRLKEQYDIRSYIFALNFFESLDKPYVTGQVMFMDDIGLIQEIQLKGTEQITFKIRSGSSPEGGATWQMTFNIVSIIEATRTSERVEAYHINLISPHAFRDQNIKISRSYTGRITEISEAILKNHLEVDLDRSYADGETEVQEPVRIITPYISPLESVVWLIDRATTSIGAPYYIYQTLYDQQQGAEGEEPKDKLRLGNLETMMSQEGFNSNLHAQHTISGANQVALKTYAEQKSTVKAYAVANVEDTLKLCQEGALGANLIQLDTFTSQRFVRHLDTGNLLDRLTSRSIISDRTLQNVYDEEQKITVGGEEKTLGECDSRFLTSINSFGTYGTVNSYADVQDQSQAMNKIRSSSVKSLLNRNMIDVTINGSLTFAPLEEGGGNSLLTVGDVIWIDFIESNVDKLTPVKNKELSGKYLIHKARNIYRDTIHETIISVSKLERDKPETAD